MSEITKIIDKYPQLSQDEILDLLKINDFNSRELIFFGTIKLACKFLSRYGLDPTEYLGLAWSACDVSCRKYDPSRGAKFVTMYCWRLRSKISHEYDRNSRKSNKLDIAISLDQEMLSDEGTTFNDVVADDTAEMPFDDLQDADRLAELYNAIDKCLTKKQRYAILGSLSGKTQREIGKDLKLTHQAVSQIQQRAIKTLSKHYCEKDKIEEINEKS